MSALKTTVTTGTELASRRGWLFALLCAAQVTVILAMSMLSVALPDIQKTLGSSAPELALMTAAYGMSFSGLLLLGGKLADAWSGRKTLALGAGLLLLGSAICLLAPTTWTALTGRFVEGAGAALMVPGAISLVRTLFPEPAEFRKAMSVWGVLAGLGGIAGLLYGAAVVTAVSWRFCFVLPMVIAVVVLCAYRALPAERDKGFRLAGLDWPGAAAITAAMSFLSYGLVIAPERGWLSLEALLTLLAGTVALVLFFWVEQRSAAPLIPLALIATTRRLGAFGAMFLCAAGITTIYYELSLYFRLSLGWLPLQSAAGFLPLGLVLVATSVAVGTVLHRMRSSLMLFLGLVLAAAGLWLVGGISDGAGYSGVLVIGLFIMPVGIALIFSAATVLATSDADPESSGMIGAALNGAMEMGATVGLALLVSLAGVVTGLQAAPQSRAAVDLGFGISLRTVAIVFALGAVASGVWVLRGRAKN